MQIFMNEKPVECGEGTSIYGLLVQEGITQQNIAVAVDDTVIPRGEWGRTILCEGCRLIVIKAVQGG